MATHNAFASFALKGSPETEPRRPGRAFGARTPSSAARDVDGAQEVADAYASRSDP
ncbi:hypothetical protein BDSB_24870 [Burkholderia dolosa PC543]|nr:hypothetical protein BDSB_24870 [Burkholderia dolosa PC543]